MTIKVRDAAGQLRTVDTIKVRDAGGQLRNIAFVRVRGLDGVLRTVFEAGGAPPSSNPAYITPGSRSTSSYIAAATAYFTANSSGAVPSAYSWGVLDGNGSGVSGGNAQTAQLRVIAQAQSEFSDATFYCDVTIDGNVYRALVTFSHYWASKNNGDVLP